MAFIELENLRVLRPSGHVALDEIGFSLEKGSFCAILAADGAGKSTLCRALVGLVSPDKGSVRIDGHGWGSGDGRRELRKRIGFVFENFDDMFFSSYAMEDLRFAALNFGLPPAEADEKAAAALAAVGMSGAASLSPQLLPVWDRLRLAVAGVLVHDPDIIVIDDPFLRLSSLEKKAFCRLLKKLSGSGKTLIYTCSDAEDAVVAERLLLMHEGRLLAEGECRALLSDIKLLEKAGLPAPFAVRVYHDLLASGAVLERCPLNIDELVEEVCR